MPKPRFTPAQQAIMDHRWRDKKMLTRTSNDFLQMWRNRVSTRVFWRLFKSPILDAGCGRGELVAELLRHGEDAFGIDLSFLKPSRKQVVLRLHQNIPPDRLLAGTGENIPFADASFNTVFDSDGPITYCDSPEMFEKVFAEYLRVLRVHGRIIITSTQLVGPNMFMIENNWRVIDHDDFATPERLMEHSFSAISGKKESHQISTRTILTNIEYDRDADYHWDHGIGIITKLKRHSAA